MTASPKPNIIVGWHSPLFAMWTVMVDADAKADAVAAGSADLDTPGKLLRFLGTIWFRGLLRWLGWCLPHYTSDKNGESYRFLAFHLNVIRGPFRCVFCGRATTQGPDLAFLIPPHCGKKTCVDQAHDDRDKETVPTEGGK